MFENAKYIKAQEYPSEFSFYDPAPFFRKEFTLKDVSEAHIFVQSPGFARYYINGKDITKDLFISAVSDYTKILWYNEYDVTHLLRKGKNVICVIAGNGYLNESFRTAWDFDTAPWRDAPQFILNLCVDSKSVVVSDKSWKCSQKKSHIIFNHLRSGEYWDMRKKDDAWMSVGYNDSDWEDAKERKEPPTGELRPVRCQPMRETERIEPKTITRTERGYLVDFGVNISGYIEVSFKEERDREILFYYAEDIDEKGAPKHNGMDIPNFYPESPFQLNKMIASGGVDTFKPLFCYHGFQYVLIEGMSRVPLDSEICAYFTHQDIERRSSFESGDEVLNYIYNAGIRSTYSNTFWCLTDCPTREKLGWMNDAQASMEQILINFDIVPLLEKWYGDILASMFDDNSLHGTVPSPDWSWGHTCGPVCDCLLYELPYKVYLYTGRSDLLLAGIAHFERYIEFLEKKVAEGHEFSLGDWMSNARKNAVPKQMVTDIHLLKAYDITSFAHRIAKTEQNKWEDIRNTWRKTLAERYTDSNGRCTVNEQTAVAMLLRMNVGENRTALAEQLLSVVARDGYQFRVGMVGIQYVYYALLDIGRGDLAYRMITNTVPGYRTWFQKGATTLWEKWDGDNSGSHNHHMYSGVIAYFFRGLLGITPLENASGFEKIELCPSFITELGYVKGSIQTVRGKIDAEWQTESGGFKYTVTLPENISATFRGRTLKKGINEFFVSQEEVL